MSGKEFQRELQSANEECGRLREENKRLRQLLTDHGIPITATRTQAPTLVQGVGSTSNIVSHASDSKAKIALFRSLFRGREDVYAVGWENPDGRAGYIPKADRNWKAYYASRLEDRKKVDRKTRTFRPLTDEVIRQHLAGEQTIGIYPLLVDETCWFLAVDFDKKTWQEDSAAFLDVSQELRVPAALERSRSGNGGHVWIFFDRIVPAVTARKLGCTILTQTMERRHQIGLNSYDRFFPNQDTMLWKSDCAAIAESPTSVWK